MNAIWPVLVATGCIAIPSPAIAGALFAGTYAHDTSVPFRHGGPEQGVDLQMGWRGHRIGKTPLQPYAFLAVNTAGDTNYGAVGLSMKIGKMIFLRPGLGIALHTGSTAKYFDPNDNEIEFGSRILFEPELGIGATLTERFSVEASWVHMSHGQLFGRQNPGINNLGVRMTWKLR